MSSAPKGWCPEMQRAQSKENDRKRAPIADPAAPFTPAIPKGRPGLLIWSFLIKLLKSFAMFHENHLQEHIPDLRVQKF
ncbi:hypothetical protein chiPu_0004392 [Chiloscyllium punctatum]|uniref:Uncharacterized protein n=1 Tax=Chiloscyllium punctatum TaxID=137246 RepID=A0A401S6H7_CHIPU|nr:hypothetical protein [Chiloscyllium punctatum]